MASAANHIQDIAIIGAGGQLGSLVVKALLSSETQSFRIKAITRSDSSAASSIPTSPNIVIETGSYEDIDFLTKALTGQDALVIILGFAAPPSLYSGFFKAAAAAKVPYILPTEFGSDTSRKDLVDSVPLLQSKVVWRGEIEKLGVSSWIAVVSNPWFDYSTQTGHFGINVKAKKATIWDDGQARANTTMLPTVGLAIARVLSLPVSAPAGTASLESYKNGFVYVRSFSVSQNEMLEAIQSVTGKDGWEVSKRSLDGVIQEGKDKVAAGDFMANITVLYGQTFKPGVGADYSGPLANEGLGLPEEDFNEAVREIVKNIQSS